MIGPFFWEAARKTARPSMQRAERSSCSTPFHASVGSDPEEVTRPIAGDLRHLLAINSVSQQFLGCLHRATRPDWRPIPWQQYPIFIRGVGSHSVPGYIEIVAPDYGEDQIANSSSIGGGRITPSVSTSPSAD